MRLGALSRRRTGPGPPPSTAYRLRKFAQRNKVTVAACLLIAASLLVGTVISTWQAIRATTAERLAHQRLVQEQKAKDEAITARQDTAYQRDRAVNAESESQANLQSLRQVAREFATSETLTGDAQRAETAIRLAEAANVSKAWTEILRGQSDIDQGRPKDAVTRLRPITAVTYPHGDDDTRLAAFSLLAYAQLQNGDEDDFLRCTQRVLEFRHDPGPEAGLFRAVAELWVDPAKAVASLEAAAKKRFYPASLLIRARTRTLDALLKQDHALVLEAQKDLEFAELFAGNSPMVLLVKLRVHGYGHEVAIKVGDSQAAESHLAELASCLPELEQRPNSVVNTYSIAGAYARLNRWDKVLDVESNTDWGQAYFIQFAAAHLYEQVADPQVALARFEQLRADENNPYRLAALACLCAEIADKRGELRGLFQRVVAENQDSVVVRCRALDILALMGKPAELRDEARTILDRLGGETDSLGWEPPLHYLAGDWDEQHALEVVSSSTLRSQSYMHYYMGIERIACGDRDGARRHFEACLTPAFETTSRAWARARLARMDRDPNWPNWIEKQP